MAKPKHILVVRLSAMGDVAMTVPVLRVLLDTYPDLRVTVVSRGFFKPFFQTLPGIDFLDADIYGKHKGIPGLIKLARERSEEHTSELQSRGHLVCRLLLEKKNGPLDPENRGLNDV